VVDEAKLQRLMAEVGRRARGPGRIYLTGGATALLFGWRSSTVDVDIKLDPEPPGVFEAIASLKNELDVNVELASPEEKLSRFRKPPYRTARSSRRERRLVGGGPTGLHASWGRVWRQTLREADLFLPPLREWRERSIPIATHGRVEFFHYDLRAQALAKIARAHERDLRDVQAMLERGLVSVEQLRAAYRDIEADLIRYPNLDPEVLRSRLDALTRDPA